MRKRKRVFSISELAMKLDGEIIGRRRHLDIDGTAALDHYRHGKVTFLKSPKHLHYLEGLELRAVVLLPSSMTSVATQGPEHTYIVVENTALAIMKAQGLFAANAPKRRPRIGKGTVIMPNVTILPNTIIGKDCLIYPGVVIGTEGFRFEQETGRAVHKMRHFGGVVIGDRVEIGANSTVIQGTFEGKPTRIGDDVKIDSQVHIGHNAQIGARTLIAAQSSIGDCPIGEDCWIGTGATIVSGVSIGARAKVLLNAVVAHDVPADAMVSGFYAMDHRRWKKAWKTLQEGLA